MPPWATGEGVQDSRSLELLVEGPGELLGCREEPLAGSQNSGPEAPHLRGSRAEGKCWGAFLVVAGVQSPRLSRNPQRPREGLPARDVFCEVSGTRKGGWAPLSPAPASAPRAHRNTRPPCAQALQPRAADARPAGTAHTWQPGTHARGGEATRQAAARTSAPVRPGGKAPRPARSPTAGSAGAFAPIIPRNNSHLKIALFSVLSSF